MYRTNIYVCRRVRSIAAPIETSGRYTHTHACRLVHRRRRRRRWAGTYVGVRGEETVVQTGSTRCTDYGCNGIEPNEMLITHRLSRSTKLNQQNVFSSSSSSVTGKFARRRRSRCMHGDSIHADLTYVSSPPPLSCSICCTSGLLVSHTYTDHRPCIRSSVGDRVAFNLGTQIVLYLQFKCANNFVLDNE